MNTQTHEHNMKCKMLNVKVASDKNTWTHKHMNTIWNVKCKMQNAKCKSCERQEHMNTIWNVKC